MLAFLRMGREGNLKIHRLVGVALLHAAVLAGTGISAWAADFPAQAQPGDLGCQHAMSALTELRSGLTLPPYFSTENPEKQGGEFDPNLYFEALPHLRMEKGYTLDYVYHQDGMGGYPILYARPIAQPPYDTESAYRAAGDHPDYLKFVIPQNSPEGYFDFAAFVMMANQFYQDWHANYNDRQVVCSSQDVDAIIQSLEAQGSAARPMTPQQQQAARDIESPEPSVVINDTAATVTMVVFTKWGGFYRRTLTIGRPDHSILDEQDRPLVDYECGITF